MRKSFLLFGLLIPAVSLAQSYSITWNKVTSGGGTSSGTNGASAFSVSGSIGQPDTGGAMRGGSYSVTGGFWSFISVVETQGQPSLSITHAGNSVVISWPNIRGYSLQQNSNLAASASWVASGYSVTTNANGTNSITISAPPGSLFFRLASP
jgi:hypothetical protein